MTKAKQNKLKPKKTSTTELPIHNSAKNTQIQHSKLVSEILLECIRAGDIDSFRDALASHITISNKLRLAKKTGLGRQTLYDIIDPSKNFNPALSTVAAIFRGLAE